MVYNQTQKIVVSVLDFEQMAQLIFKDGENYDESVFKRIRYFSPDDFCYLQKEKVKPFFVVLQDNDKIIGVAKVGYFDLSAHNINNWSISFFSIDKDYRGNGHARLMTNAIFEHAKLKQYEISSSTYTVLGKQHLQHLFNEYANLHNVIFYDHTGYLHDTENMYVVVNGRKLHYSEV